MRWSTLPLAIGCVVGLSCRKGESLLQLDVVGDAPFAAGSTLVVSVNQRRAKAFANVTLEQPFRAGIYVDGNGPGSVSISAAIDDGACVRGRSAEIPIGGIAPGKVLPPVTLRVNHTASCDPLPSVDGGVDSPADSPAGTGGVAGGAGGAPASGGATGNGGGAGSGGAPASGGATGSGGIASGGAVGSGGAAGSAGSAGSAGAGGTMRSGGTTGSGGAVGSGGATGSGGAVRSGGTTGSGGVMGTGGAIGSGGAVGSGGAGACGDLIDNMEAGTGHICQGDGRIGYWYTYLDAYVGSSITPPASESPSLPLVLSPARATSTRAMHMSGTYSSFAGIGFLINAPIIDAPWSTFNASGYTGIRFFAKGAPGIRILVHIPATVATPYHGTCTLPVCVGALSISTYTVSDTWSTVSIPFTALTAGTAPFNAALLAAIEFQPIAPGPFDLWIDDVAFYR